VYLGEHFPVAGYVVHRINAGTYVESGVREWQVRGTAMMSDDPAFQAFASKFRHDDFEHFLGAIECGDKCAVARGFQSESAGAGSKVEDFLALAGTDQVRNDGSLRIVDVAARDRIPTPLIVRRCFLIVEVNGRSATVDQIQGFLLVNRARTFL
jgi:hypothetical protein